MTPFPLFHPWHAFFLMPFFFLFAALASILLIVPYWFIFKKAGFSEWLSLLMFFPLINLILLYIIAFSTWKVVPLAQVYPAPRIGYPPAP